MQYFKGFNCMLIAIKYSLNVYRMQLVDHLRVLDQLK